MLNVILHKMRKVKRMERDNEPGKLGAYAKLCEEINELLNICTLSFIDGRGQRKFTVDTLRAQLESIVAAKPVDDGTQYELLTQYEFISRFILADASLESRAMFNQLFYFMDAESRADWLHANYFIESDAVFVDRWADVIIIGNRN